MILSNTYLMDQAFADAGNPDPGFGDLLYALVLVALATWLIAPH